MFERLKRLYNEGKLGADALRNAVFKGWITEAERDDIINGEPDEQG